MATFLQNEFDVDVTRFSIRRALKDPKWSKKVTQNVARERNPDLRDEYAHEISSLRSDPLVLIDETELDRSIGTRRKGLALRGMCVLEDTYHWALMVGPKIESEGKRGTQHHAKETINANDKKDVSLAPTNMQLVRVMARNVEDKHRLQSVLRQVPTSRDTTVELCWMSPGQPRNILRHRRHLSSL